jgi:hypothetical protein
MIVLTNFCASSTSSVLCTGERSLFFSFFELYTVRNVLSLWLIVVCGISSVFVFFFLSFVIYDYQLLLHGWLLTLCSVSDPSLHVRLVVASFLSTFGSVSVSSFLLFWFCCTVVLVRLVVELVGCCFGWLFIYIRFVPVVRLVVASV